MPRWARALRVASRWALRSKLLLIAFGALAGMGATLAANFWTLETVKVGGPLYERIRERKDALARLALRRADRTQVRAERAARVVGSVPERIAPLKAHLGEVRSVVVDDFAAVGQVVHDESDLAAIE